MRVPARTISTITARGAWQNSISAAVRFFTSPSTIRKSRATIVFLVSNFFVAVQVTSKCQYPPEKTARIVPGFSGIASTATARRIGRSLDPSMIDWLVLTSTDENEPAVCESVKAILGTLFLALLLPIDLAQC